MKISILVIFLSCLIGVGGEARPRGVAPFQKVITIVLENAKYQDALAQPFLSKFAREGALLTNLKAETHPSQPNYLAIVAGSTFGVGNDNPVDINGSTIADLLDAHGKTWRVYAEGFPGNCYLSPTSGKYARKHVPFLSFINIQKNPQRCAHIVNAVALEQDLQSGAMPDYSFYAPDMNNDGHDTGVAYADQWLSKRFGPLLQNPVFMKDMLVVITFDEDDFMGSNHVYTAFYGPGVAQGSTNNTAFSHYDILRTIEEALGLGTLGKGDAQAHVISSIWKP